MVNILVVDDEPMICKGVAAILKQSKLDIGEVFIAYNGFEALDFIHLEKIDLVFTDIQMDQMNGIELIENIFMEDPSIPIVILSAHGEFEYAQKAIRFGAKEYLVKPITPPQLLSVTSKLLKEKDERQQHFSNWETGSTIADVTDLQLNYYLSEIVTGTVHESEVPDIRERLGGRLTGTHFSMLLIKLSLDRGGIRDEPISTLKDRNLLKYAALNIMTETAGSWSHFVIHTHNSTFALLMQMPEEVKHGTLGMNQMLMMAQMVHTNLQKYVNVKCQIGISRIREGIVQWPHIYDEAMESLAWGEKQKDHYMFYIEDIGKTTNQQQMTNTQVDEANNRIVYHAKTYIELHYCNKGLKLQDIADSVHLSPNYLSYLFKRVMGINIWDYVTQLRMEKGKQLILTTDKRRYEISEEIGYESPEHFSKIFKKHYGMNISELKSSGT
ncbi:response regulator [Paenibacillus sp. GCM10023248]|uniref:response regulator transcription factor n=1 Tax=Bacillales TaxID=1385 RepID=UPI002379A3B8|nr:MULTISPECIES: response regulator [Bacillales]MDD9268792.1 response regulator [Paenibacillus sp. MAHUQ-63]MDR6882129.1 two-component system response regulator YesN [Bacillus sp. 3255]